MWGGGENGWNARVGLGGAWRAGPVVKMRLFFDIIAMSIPGAGSCWDNYHFKLLPLTQQTIRIIH